MKDGVVVKVMSAICVCTRVTAVMGLCLSLQWVSSALAGEKVVYGTNWLAEPEHGGYYQALADGTYAACGLDVEIKSGGPQVNNRALLVAGKIDFLMGGNMLPPFFARKEGIPIKVVAAHFQKEPQIIMSHPGQGLDTWESLTESTIFVGDNSLTNFYRWMIVEHGFKLGKRKPYAFNSAPFIADKMSVQQGYVTSEPFAVRQQGGFEPNIFLLADYGFDTYATTIEVMEETIANHRDWVACFVEGSAIGWVNYLYGDPVLGNELIQSSNPEMTDEQIEFSIDQLRKYGIVDSGQSVLLGIGAMTDARHESFYHNMVKAGVIEGGIDYRETYTLDFVNKGVGLDVKKRLLGQQP
jgi:NitT/TauT family transport system substrate-binding protein